MGCIASSLSAVKTATFLSASTVSSPTPMATFLPSSPVFPLMRPFEHTSMRCWADVLLLASLASQVRFETCGLRTTRTQTNTSQTMRPWSSDTGTDDQQPNNALEPTAVGAFIMTITDNITSLNPVTPRSTAVAQLGR